MKTNKNLATSSDPVRLVPMKNSVEFHGDWQLLSELNIEMKKVGVSAGKTASCAKSVGGGGSDALTAVGDLAAIAAVAHAYFKHRRGRISIEVAGKKIEVEGKTTAETKEMLRCGIVCMRALDQKNKSS